MTAQLVVAGALGVLGLVSAVSAIVNERRMHRHRQPGVTYAQATLRRDGGWRRQDLFTGEGLGYQSRAARNGFLAIGLWVAALVAWIVLS